MDLLELSGNGVQDSNELLQVIDLITTVSEPVNEHIVSRLSARIIGIDVSTKEYCVIDNEDQYQINAIRSTGKFSRPLLQPFNRFTHKATLLGALTVIELIEPFPQVALIAYPSKVTVVHGPAKLRDYDKHTPTQGDIDFANKALTKILTCGGYKAT